MIKKTIVVLLVISILIPTAGCQLSELTQNSQKAIAAVQDMWAELTEKIPFFKPIATVEGMKLFRVSTGFGLSVFLKPTNVAKADTSYTVNLYENGKFRANNLVAWHQPELDVLKTGIISFPLTEEEYNACQDKDISHIFSIEITQSPLIPYGTYANTVIGYSSSITLNSDGTYSMDNPIIGRIVGTYAVSPDYIITYDPITHARTASLRYRYLDQFKCLYIYTGDQPMPFYRQ